MPDYWMIVERYDNWCIDKREGFRRFGLPALKRKLAETVAKGDLLITYVSGGRSAFADIRKVEGEAPRKLGLQGSYDAAFPIALQTSPVLVLDENQWLPLAEVKPILSFLKGRDLRQVLRQSLRKLPDEDGRMLDRRLRAKFASAG